MGCPDCGTLLAYQESCLVCRSCGYNGVGSGRVNYLPCPELKEILLRAFSPSDSHAGYCLHDAPWIPEAGHVPRGFVGALGSLDEVELVLVTAEPGNPAKRKYRGAPADEKYSVSFPLDRLGLMAQTCEYTFVAYEKWNDRFHAKTREILNQCFGEVGLAAQLRRAWLVDAYLCSAPVSGGQVPKQTWMPCARDFLCPQLRLLQEKGSNPLIVALGGKASERVRYCGVDFVSAYHPSYRYPLKQKEAQQSWDDICNADERQAISRAPLRQNGPRSRHLKSFVP